MSDKLISKRLHIGIFGDTNAGKSTLFNKILGQDMNIVSEKRGTTTDPVIKAMELLSYGPVALMDTAGLNDTGFLGEMRDTKTHKILLMTDLAIYAADINDFSEESYSKMSIEFEKLSIPYILTFTKCDKVDSFAHFKNKYENALFISQIDERSIETFKARLCDELKKIDDNDAGILNGLLPQGSTVVLVIPIDSEAPQGRLILPQVQLIRDCLDNSIKCMVGTEKQLAEMLSELKTVDLIITDSQVFGLVAEQVPENIPLTSFSVLFGRSKGDLKIFFAGADAIDTLSEGDKILIAEGCTHTTSHEDIGTVKIPNLIRKYTNKTLSFENVAGHDFPLNLTEYSLIIHCGSCMISKKETLSRIKLCMDADKPITNYGVALAKLTGILDRCKSIFE